jgi:hypothetical protein
MKRLAWLATMILAAATVVPVHGASVVTMEVRDVTSETPAVQEGYLYLDEGMLKMENLSEPGKKDAIIFRADEQKLYMIDHEEKSYSVMDQETMQRMASYMENAMKQVEQQLAGLPEEQRKQIEKMMKQQMPGLGGEPKSWRLDELGSKEIAGYPCKGYAGYLDDEKVIELWITPFDRVGVGEKEFAVFQALQDFFGQLFSSSPMMERAMENASFFRALEQLDGFPILVREYEGGELVAESLVKKVDRVKLSEKDFSVPEGYSRRKLMEMPE